MYHFAGTRHLRKCKVRFRMPDFPPITEVITIDAAGGPISIIGNINMPSRVEIGFPFDNSGATKRKAPVQERKKVRRK